MLLPVAPASSPSFAESEPANPLRLLVFHTQQLSLLLLTAGSMPGALAGLLSIFSSAGNGFSLSSLTAMECLQSAWSVPHQCWAALLGPVLVGMAAAGAYVRSKKCRGQTRAQDPFSQVSV
jgi:hypothetical protein